MYSVQLKLRLSKARNNRKCCRQHCWALPGPVCLHPEVAESLRSSLEAGDVFVVINLMPSEVEAGIGMGCHGSRCSWPWPLLGTKVFAEYHQDFIATLEVAPILYIYASYASVRRWPLCTLLGSRSARTATPVEMGCSRSAFSSLMLAFTYVRCRYGPELYTDRWCCRDPDNRLQRQGIQN